MPEEINNTNNAAAAEVAYFTITNDPSSNIIDDDHDDDVIANDNRSSPPISLVSLSSSSCQQQKQKKQKHQDLEKNQFSSISASFTGNANANANANNTSSSSSNQIIDHQAMNGTFDVEKKIELLVSTKSDNQTKCCSMPKRYLLMLMKCLCGMMLYMLRVNISVAIVSMVRQSESSPSPSSLSLSSLSSTLSSITANNVTTSATITRNNEGEFDWSENTQGFILGSFFWGYVITQLPGGHLADSIGSKHLLGSGIFFTSLLTIVSPFAARIHYLLFVICRVIEGLFEGLVIPAMHSMIAKWFPPAERSTASAIIYSGGPIGTVITMPLAALLCESNIFGGWPSVFYFFGLAGVVWTILWMWLIHETPASHPTITQRELRMILKGQTEANVNIGFGPNGSAKQIKPKVPWRHILTSMPVWAVVVGHFGQNWGFYTMLTQLPRYFKKVLNLDLKSNGLYSALPYLLQSLIGCSMGVVCDRIYRTRRFSLSTLRKTFNTIGFLGAAVCIFLITCIGRDKFWNIVLLTTALGINGCHMAGLTVSLVDMSPRFSGTLMGLSNCVANFAGIFAPMVIGKILSHVDGDDDTSNDDDDDILLGWHYVFYLAAGVFAASGLFFLAFQSSEVQKWNEPKEIVANSNGDKENGGGSGGTPSGIVKELKRM